MRWDPDELWRRAMAMKWRQQALLLLALLSVVWCAHVWTTDDPPDHGAAIPVGGVMALIGIYTLSALEWLVTRHKKTR